MKAELDAGRPVLYAGFGSGGGHCFVADGYDNNSYFHFNWGWGGAYDGYFQVNALNPSGTGIGGGSGGFNSGHHAVIGIEPPSVTQTYNLALYAALTPSAATINYGDAFSITTNLVNKGTATFSGDYAVAVFDNAYNFVDFVETKTGFNLQGGYVYTNNLVFSSTGLLSMLPGKYYAGLFYRPSGGNWVQVEDNGSYTNLVSITVTNPNTIELNADMTVTPGTALTKGSPASVNLNIRNDGSTTFKGQFAVDLYTLDGNWAQAIGTIDESEGLPAGYTYLAPYLTFTTNAITVEPGTYLMAVMHKAVGGTWELSGSTYFQNPIKVTVVAPSIQPDIFEDNNSVSQAYSLPVTFSGNTAAINTSGSNCHITTDNDYFKIVLPAGYNYTITPRLRDSYNSGNGIIYTLDGLFSYSADGTTWSEAFDDVMPGNIPVTGSGTVYFHIAPYFAGETGSYLLDIALTRISTVGIDPAKDQNLVKIFPNPAKDYITVDCSGFTGNLSRVSLINMQGKEVFTLAVTNATEVQSIALPQLAAGVYSMQLVTDQGILTRKINISR
ncbi:MAG: C10 family peptidase [Bacteroidales bacterium]